MSGSNVRGVWKKHDFRKPAQGSPARLVRHALSRLNTYIYSHVKAGTMSTKCFWRGRVRTDQLWEEGVRACSGQPGSSTRLWRSLSTNSPVSLRPPLGARLKATQGGGGSQPEERHDPTAVVLKIIRRRKIPVRGSLENIPVPTIF
jgi:hypothetical protein